MSSPSRQKGENSAANRAPERPRIVDLSVSKTFTLVWAALAPPTNPAGPSIVIHLAGNLPEHLPTSRQTRSRRLFGTKCRRRRRPHDRREIRPINGPHAALQHIVKVARLGGIETACYGTCTCSSRSPSRRLCPASSSSRRRRRQGLPNKHRQPDRRAGSRRAGTRLPQHLAPAPRATPNRMPHRAGVSLDAAHDPFQPPSAAAHEAVPEPFDARQSRLYSRCSHHTVSTGRDFPKTGAGASLVFACSC